MAVSTTGSASNGLVYLTMIGHDAAGHATIAQGSGVLLSNDEVLTAAHVVYNDDGSLRTAGVASVGYHAGSSIATAMVDGVQALPKQDYTTVAGIGSDFAVVHLKTPVADGTIFGLGSDLATGTFSVSGYPVGTGGVLDTKTEPLTVASGTQIYTGETLHDGSGNPEGSSGGSVYQVINGRPTAFGVISADASTDATKGFFKALTAADVAQIQSWVSGADAAATQPAVAAAPVPHPSDAALAAATTTAATSQSSVPGLSHDAASALTSDAEFITGQQHAIMTDVAAAITQVCDQGSTAAQMTQDAVGYLDGASPSLAKRAVAYLAGFLSGTSGSTDSDIPTAANALIAGAVDSAATRRAAAAGHAEGLAMGYGNTSATIDPASAAWGDVLSVSGARATAATALPALHEAQQAFHVLATRHHH